MYIQTLFSFCNYSCLFIDREKLFFFLQDYFTAQKICASQSHVLVLCGRMYLRLLKEIQNVYDSVQNTFFPTWLPSPSTPTPGRHSHIVSLSFWLKQDARIACFDWVLVQEHPGQVEKLCWGTGRVVRIKHQLACLRSLRYQTPLVTLPWTKIVTALSSALREIKIIILMCMGLCGYWVEIQCVVLLAML